MPSPTPPSSFDRWLFYLACAGLAFLIYILGAAVMYYRLPSSGLLLEAFQAGNAWQETLKGATKREKRKKQIAESQLTINPDTRMLESSEVSWNKKLAYEGYTLISMRFSSTAYLLDMEGRVAHQWHMPFTKAWPDPTHIHSLARANTFISKAYVYPNGDLLAQYMGAGDTPYGYGMAKMDKDGNLLWTYDENTHHDFYVAQDGTIYVIVHELQRNPGQRKNSLWKTVLTDYIVQLSPDGKEISRISIFDAFKNSKFADALNIPVRKRNKAWDFFHTNTVMKLEADMAKTFPLFKPGYILISMRSMDMIAVVDPETQQVVWTLQGPWKWPHAANFLKNGHILVMDNLWRDEKNLPATRVLEINPNTAEIAWQFPDKTPYYFRTPIFGRLQRLPNQNTLIAETMNARLLEVAPQGDIVWSYAFKISKNNAIMTATRYNADDVPFLKQ